VGQEIRPAEVKAEWFLDGPTEGSAEAGGAGRLLTRLVWLVDLGTSGYPPKVRRRLRNINLGCYVVATSCAFFALTYALEDAALHRGAIVINLAMMGAALSAPVFHRIHESAGALFVALTVLAGLFVIVGLVGRESGIQINFIATSALAFLIFELRRLHFIVLIVALAIALHIAAWVLFEDPAVPGHVSGEFLTRLYISTVVTISIIVAVIVYYAFWTAERAEAETETLLYRVLPAPVAERLKAKPHEPLADSFDNAAVLFADIVGFVPIARGLGSEQTVAMLNQLVQRFDRLAAAHGMEKIKTIGDAYMAAALVGSAAENASRTAQTALKMQAAADAVGAAFGVRLDLRIGAALGPAMAGVIGSSRFGYDVWGDPVNLAARLESTSEPRAIHVSGTFRNAVADAFAFERRGALDIKGVGPQETWFMRRETSIVE
jgi:adenylate cyclase